MDDGRQVTTWRPSSYLSFLLRLTVSVTVVLGLRWTVDFLTNRPVFALRLTFGMAALLSASRGSTASDAYTWLVETQIA